MEYKECARQSVVLQDTRDALLSLTHPRHRFFLLVLYCKKIHLHPDDPTSKFTVIGFGHSLDNIKVRYKESRGGEVKKICNVKQKGVVQWEI